MPVKSSVEPRGEEYLIASRAAGPDGVRDLQEVVSQVAKLPGAKVIESKAPGRLVVSMSPAQADGLRAAFGGRIIVEPNAELRF